MNASWLNIDPLNNYSFSQGDKKEPIENSCSFIIQTGVLCPDACQSKKVIVPFERNTMTITS